MAAVRVLRVFGKGEGWVEKTLGDLEGEIPGLSLGYQAVRPEMLVKLRARSDSEEENRAVLDRAEAIARQRLGDLIYAVGDKSLAATLLEILSSRGMTLAIAESCTGGLVGKLLTDVPGASSAFLLSIVTYSNEMKEDLLAVPSQILAVHGAVSAACARAMAEGVRKLSGADLGAAITGIAGPEGGTEDKPVGTVFIAVCDERETVVKHRWFPVRDRSFVRSLSAATALALVRRRLLEQSPG